VPLPEVDWLAGVIRILLREGPGEEPYTAPAAPLFPLTNGICACWEPCPGGERGLGEYPCSIDSRAMLGVRREPPGPDAAPCELGDAYDEGYAPPLLPGGIRPSEVVWFVYCVPAGEDEA
jgi:hypothetical protein